MKDGLIAASAIVGAVFLAVGAVTLLHAPVVLANGQSATTTITN